MENKKTIKIASLNLWRFNEWERRLPLIIETIKKLDPDVILLQEVQKDISKDDRNQLEILNNELQFPYSQFTLADIKTTRKGQPLPYPVDHGLGILSKFEFDTEVARLTKGVGDKEQRILQINTKIVNVHFSNSDEWAEAHFKETLTVLDGDRNILVGDFNVKDILKYRDLFDAVYTTSSSVYNYISYPADNLSYDYVLISKNFKFREFECRDELVSDHKMLVTTIEL